MPWKIVIDFAPGSNPPDNNPRHISRVPGDTSIEQGIEFALRNAGISGIKAENSMALYTAYQITVEPTI